MRLPLALALALALSACGPPAAPRVRSAQDYYVDGKLQFQVEQFQAALDDWENAYLLHPDPALLFDIGQANRKLGRLDRALENFRDYLAALPDGENRPAVEKLIAEIKREQKKKR